MIVRYEQAVYGSFPFRDTGYAALASSEGCRPDWLDSFYLVCREIGEKPASSGDLNDMMFSLRIKPNGPWMIVGVSSPGSDDRGRPGALAFHALFIDAREFRKVGYDPFALCSALRSDWNSTTTLSAGSIDAVKSNLGIGGARSIAISTALLRGRKVAIASDVPISEVARQVWERLPVRARKRCSVTTWAFANGPGFDLVAAPNLAGWSFEGPYRDPFEEEASSFVQKWRRTSWLQAGIMATLGITITSFTSWQLWMHARLPRDQNMSVNRVPQAVSFSSKNSPRRARDLVAGPLAAAYPDDSHDSVAASEIFAKLVVLGRDHLGIRDFALLGELVPSDLDYVLNEVGSLRYTGPLLTIAELAELGGETGSGRSRALAWDAMIRRFVADRWPSDVRLAHAIGEGPLRWQIDTLAWSFHMELDPKLTVTEAVDAIVDALKLDEPISSNPLELKYPTLSEYSNFLKRLSVR